MVNRVCLKVCLVCGGTQDKINTTMKIDLSSAHLTHISPTAIIDWVDEMWVALQTNRLQRQPVYKYKAYNIVATDSQARGSPLRARYC